MKVEPLEVSLSEQIEAMRRELATRERVYPTKIRMGQMTEDLAAAGLGRIRAIITTLETISKTRKQVGNLLKLEPTLNAIHECASQHKGCDSCRAICYLLEDSLGFVRR